MTTPKKSATPAGKKPSKLPSKQISFSGQATSKKGAQGKGGTAAPTGKKGGVNLMRKLSGM